MMKDGDRIAIFVTDLASPSNGCGSLANSGDAHIATMQNDRRCLSVAMVLYYPLKSD
jgi:hypothetical protein